MMLKHAAWLFVCASLSTCAPTDEAIFSDSANNAGAAAGGFAGLGTDSPNNPVGLGGASTAGNSSAAAGTVAQGGPSQAAGTGGANAGSGEGTEVVCGNGAIEDNEGCDDGGNEEGDGCSAECEVQCTDFDPGARPGPDGSCYELRARFATWQAAQSNCEASNAHLVTITSEEENAFVDEIVTAPAWLGATDGKDDRQPNSGTYTWITGEPFSYQAWEGDNPNALAYPCGGSRCYEHCAGIDDRGDWKDWPCRANAVIICEWDPQGKRF